MSKIEQLISEIEMYLDSCKAQPFTNNKRIVVEKDVIDEMLVELRMQTPDEIKRYQKIISNKDAIIADAQAQASNIIDDATRQTEQIVSEHQITAQAQAQAAEILRSAQAQAQEIVDKAVLDSNQIREGAINYTDSQLATLQNILSDALTNTESRYKGFMGQLNDALSVVISNRKQLYPTSAAPSEPVDSSEDDGEGIKLS